MRIEIRARGLRLTKAQEAQVKEKLERALERFANDVRRVIVSAHHGGLPSAPEDVLCRIDVHVGLTKARVADLDPHPVVGLHRATDRAARAVTRALQRLHLMGEHQAEAGRGGGR